jgi:hypothetical protein
MKVPTYERQIGQTQSIGAQRMSVQAQPGQFGRAAEAQSEFFGTLSKAVTDFGVQYAKQENETQRLRALNESDRMISEAQAAAEKIALQDPAEADRYFTESVKQFREANASTISNDATRQSFLLQYDAGAQRSIAKVANYTNGVRLRQSTAEWMKTEGNLINRASNGDSIALLELYGDETKGIPGHYDRGVNLGFIDPVKAAGRKDTSRTLVAKNRLISHIDTLNTSDDLETLIAGLENGEIPPNLADDFSMLLPSEIKQLKNAINTEIRSEKALEEAAAAVLSDEQRTEFEQFFDDPEIPLEQKKEKLLNLMLGDPDLAGMESGDRRATIAYARARLSTNQATVNSRVRSIEKQQDAILKKREQGFPVSLQEVLDVDKQIAALGDQAPEDLVRSQLTLERTIDELNAMGQMGPLELERKISDLEKGYKDTGTVSVEDASIITTGRKMLSSLNTRIKSNDAMGAAQDMGLIDMPDMIPALYASDDAGRVVTDENGRPQPNPRFAAQAGDRRQKAYFVANKFGLAQPQFLTKTEVAQYKERLANGDTGTRMVLLQTLVKGFGSDAPLVLSEISGEKHVGIFGHIGGLIVDNNNEAAEDILRGMSLIEGDLTMIGFDKATNDIHFRREVGTALDGLEGAESSLREAADAIYATRYGRDVKGFQPRNYQDAIQAAAGRTPDGRGGIDIVNKAPTLIPQNMLAADMVDLIATLREEDLINPQISGQNISREIAANIRRNPDDYKAHPAPGTDRYFIYRGELGDLNFRYINDTNGDPLLVDFANLFRLRGQ